MQIEAGVHLYVMPLQLLSSHVRQSDVTFTERLLRHF
jgi:hypothetical protein